MAVAVMRMELDAAGLRRAVAHSRDADAARRMLALALVLDGHNRHQPGGLLKVPDNISLLPLRPYSPELNPQENIWQYLRQNYLSNRIFDTYDIIVDACCDA